MSRVESLADDWRRSCWSDPWHGPSLGSLLRGVDAATAAARPVSGAHSIWELVLHVTGWTCEVARRMEGGEPAMPEEGDWPDVGEASPARWQAALDALAESQARLDRVLTAFPETRLTERVGGARDAPLGTGVTYEGMVRGALQHNGYHGGQIALLRRAAERRA